MILPVYIIGHPILRRISQSVPEGMEGLGSLLTDMWETMYKIDGVGLAAPQIGKSLRIFVIDASAYAEDDPSLQDLKKTFINAEILEYSGEPYPDGEGCLSIPGINEDIIRPESIKIRYQDEEFKWHEDIYSGRAARIVQHEYDHLEGKLFVDKLNPIRRRLLTSQINSISKGKTPVRYKVVLPSSRKKA